MSREGQQSAGAPSVEGDLGRPSAATGQEATDPVFAAEQAHLSETYGKLEKIGRDAIAAMEAVARDAAEDKKSMAEELAVNFATWDDILETHADIVAMNNIIEAHDMANSVQAERLRAVEVLLREPYFAKIALQFKEGHPAKELYIGSAGISDENYRRLVVDWRSPVAEVYYNQTMGPTSYVADGRTIHVDLQLRRQFEIEEDRLITYFDSDVAIEDKLLLASLSRGRSAHMQAITATIQREQNAGVRLLGGDAVEKVSAKFANLPAGPHRATLMAEELSARLTARLKSLAALEDTHDEIASLPVDEQLRLFGEVFDPQSDEEARTLALVYLEEKHADALRAMDAMEWLDIDRVAVRLLGREGLTSVEWVYLKMALTGLGNPEARYVMIDEAQDYSQGQLAVLARYFRRAHFLLLGDPNQAIFEGTATWDEMRAVFEEMRGEVSQCRLMTSYRSTPAITDLFARLLPAGEAMEVASVQREAPAPEIVVCENADEWKAALVEAVRVACDAGGLTAVIVLWKNDAKRLAKTLDGVTVLGEGDSLPETGIVVVPLKLAKGLEFDRVIIPDASARTFPNSDIARRRLYTTISRATRHLTLLSNGDLTELLG